MRKLIIASALASTGIAAPALAQERGPYVGVDAGFVKPQQLNLTLVNSAGSISNGERLRHKHGYDVDGVIGYDFGMFRLEGEVAYKHARLKSAMLDPNALAAVLLSPVTNTIVPAATGRSNVSSGMINALLDLGPSSGVNGSIGLGAGAARANYRAGLVPSNALNFSGQDRAFAWQALAEVRFPVSASVDVGLKYRYFQTAKLNFGQFCVTTCTTALPYRLQGKYKSSSLLASVGFNFGRAVMAPPPPPPPPPPPAPPPQATQTCPDGSVVPATEACPAPPPPPPPPPPLAQQGERGE